MLNTKDAKATNLLLENISGKLEKYNHPTYKNLGQI